MDHGAQYTAEEAAGRWGQADQAAAAEEAAGEAVNGDAVLLEAFVGFASSCLEGYCSMVCVYDVM